MRVFASGISAILTLGLIAAGLGGFQGEPDYRQEIYDVLSARNEILSEAYFEGKDCTRSLKKVLSEPLLSREIEDMTKGKDTDFQKIIDFDIVSCDMISHIDDRLQFYVEIDWCFEGEDGPEYDRNGRAEYLIGMEGKKLFEFKAV